MSVFLLSYLGKEKLSSAVCEAVEAVRGSISNQIEMFKKKIGSKTLRVANFKMLSIMCSKLFLQDLL